MIDVFLNIKSGIAIGFCIGICAFLLGFGVSSGLRLFEVGSE